MKITVAETEFEKFLEQHDEEAWTSALTVLLPLVHEVDKAAVQIWFAFYPLSLFQALRESENPKELAKQLLLQGNYRLEDQIDASHAFLYGHRFWPDVKRAVEDFAGSFHDRTEAHLADLILQLANQVAGKLKIETSLIVSITAAAFMTIRQVGLQPFREASGQMLLDDKHRRRTPNQILKERAKDDGQGLLGFLRTVDKRWTVTFDENDDSAKYKMKHMQDLAWGAADDRSRNWREIDPRRIEGPIPVECRSASCGTCWVGVLAGAEKLSDVAARERKQIKRFGYICTNELKPFIRLACQAQTYGAVSIVIPPWNGVFGEYLQSRTKPQGN